MLVKMLSNGRGIFVYFNPLLLFFDVIINIFNSQWIPLIRSFLGWRKDRALTEERSYFAHSLELLCKIFDVNQISIEFITKSADIEGKQKKEATFSLKLGFKY